MKVVVVVVVVVIVVVTFYHCLFDLHYAFPLEFKANERQRTETRKSNKMWSLEMFIYSSDIRQSTVEISKPNLANPK